ncbi:low temperature requirement protein A [Micromonospora sp. DR5-3]|uniref:low temperature requirement protein A n=1 Tax=unclassified Micromonospora TaxID=2617518 RepID=UPI0011D5C0D4|nr:MULTISPECIES: low temperature requirement protein A [unclassified Micromonospora]MCW3817769.1 low temperature requirement protein A [Micromonospora sp. DR5-3]TYC20574.1 low temperature requirement protein A [Micromonospora sp. MP36]
MTTGDETGGQVDRAAREAPGVVSTRATFLELFFDLVFVFALTRITARSFQDLALEPGGTTGFSPITGGGKTLLLLLALYTVWQGTAWTTSRYDPYRFGLQLVVIIALVGSMIMGVAIPRAFRAAGLAFAVAYVVTQVSRPLILLTTLGRHHNRGLKLRMLITYCATAVLWLVGAFLPTNPRTVLWTVALAIEYLAGRTGWPVPGLGRSAVSRWDIAGEHLAERYRQFFLVALGETILVAGFAYSARPISRNPTVAFALALLTSILLWRIYFQRAGQILGEAVLKAKHPATIGRSAADTHMIMLAGTAAIAIGYQLAIEHPLDRAEAAWVTLIILGPAVFLAGRARFEYEVFGRVSPSRWIAILALLASVPLLLFHPPLIASTVAAAVLAAVAVADARRARGKPPEAAKPPF